MKKTIFLGTLGVIFLFISGLSYFIYLYSSFGDGSNENDIVIVSPKRGEIIDVALSAKVIIIKDEGGGNLNLAITSQTKFFDDNNNPVSFNFFQKGLVIEAQGTFKDNNFIASEIKTIKAPNIMVYSPQPDDTVGELFAVEGKARVFENQLNLRVTANGQKIYEDGVMANAPDVGQFGDFEKRIQLDSTTLRGITQITLEAFDYSAKDGSEIDRVSIPLNFESGDNTTVKIYFNNNKLDPEVSCYKVFPVNRKIIRTPAIGRASLEELLKGPTEDEKAQGYFTNINPGVKIQSLTIDASSTALVDFDDSLQDRVGGSCRVAAIRAQITQTLKQFPGVHDVIISINGNSTSTLQP